MKMKIVRYKKTRQILFYVAYTILITHYIFKSITFVNNTANTVVYALGIFIIILLGLFNVLENGIKNSLSIIIITALLAILCSLTHDLLLPIIWLLIIAFGKSDFEKIVEYDLCIKTALVLLVVILSLTGILNIESMHFRGEVTRLSLGFSNPNIFSSYLLSIIMELLYLRRKKYSITEIAISLIAIAVILFTTGSRTQIICIATINILFLINRIKPKLYSNKIINWIGNNIFTIVTVASLIIFLFYLLVPQTRNAINAILPDRIRLPANVIKATGLWPFGNLAYANSSFDSALDNLPLFITVVYGIIPLTFTCIAMKKYMKNLDNKTTRAIYLIMLIYLLSCLTEKLCFRPQYNIFLLYASTFLFDKSSSSKSKHIQSTLTQKEKIYNKYLTIKELQQSELKVLEWFDKICQKNNLRYYVYGGTLLGTIRHHGFIPWDDDIDTIMPRPDYEKLAEILKKHDYKTKNIQVKSLETTSSTDYPFLKIYNTEVKILEAGSAVDETAYAWIDVFPVDGINKPTKKNLKKTAFLKRVFEAKRAQTYNYDSKRLNNIQKTLHRIRRSPLYLIPLDKYLKFFINKCKKVKFQDSEYVCDTVWAKHPGNILKKEWLNETIRMPFEDIEVNVFGGYKHYLENRYGKDYMKLPPKEKQITHGIKAYKIDKEA